MRSATHAGTVIGSDLASGTVSVSFVGGGSVSNAACFTPTLPAVASTVLCELASDGSTVVTGTLVTPWNPTAVSGMSLWLDANDAGTITQTGAQIIQWADKSGNARNATPYAGVAGPEVHAGAVNGKNAVRFGNGTRTGLLLPTVASNGTFTVAGVVSPPYGTGHSLVLAGTNSTNLQINPPGGGIQIYSAMSVQTAAVSMAGPMAVVSQFGPSAFIRVNGALLASGNSGNRSMPAPALGCANADAAPYYFEGDIAELIIWDRALSPAEYQEVEAYLTSKWGTP